MYRAIRTLVIVLLLLCIAGLVRERGVIGIFELFHSGGGGSASTPWVAPWNRQQLTDPFRRAADAVFPHACTWTGEGGPEDQPRTVTLDLSARGIYRYGYIHTGNGLSAYIACEVNAPPVLNCRNESNIIITGRVSPDGNTLTGRLFVWFWHPDEVSFTLTRTDATASNPVASAASAAEATAVTAVQERFHLLANSPVYEGPDNASPVVAQVHLDKYVNVIGTTGGWL
jgi:hypothetical protein